LSRSPEPPPPSPRSLHDALPISIIPLGLADRRDPNHARDPGDDPIVVAEHDLGRAPIVERGRPPAKARVADRVVPEGRLGGGAEDRKSTRLNSSHVKISYAVFCL